jgi:16S rRNA (uracil1498-N3)-methyltransferase
MAYCGDFVNPHIKNYLQKGHNIALLVGPEGDFSPSEVQLAQSYGFKTVGLGTARLRTETAGVIACGIVNFSNED